jgi:hypothetical protein
MALLATPDRVVRQQVDAEAVLGYVATLPPEQQQQWLRQLKARLYRTCDVLLPPEQAAQRKSHYHTLLHQPRISQKTLLELVKEVEVQEKLAVAAVQRRQQQPLRPGPQASVLRRDAPVAAPATRGRLGGQGRVGEPPASASQLAAPMPTGLRSSGPQSHSEVLSGLLPPQEPIKRSLASAPDLWDLAEPCPSVVVVTPQEVLPEGLEPSGSSFQHRWSPAPAPRPSAEQSSVASLAALPLPATTLQSKPFELTRAMPRDREVNQIAGSTARSPLTSHAPNDLPPIEVPATPPRDVNLSEKSIIGLPGKLSAAVSATAPASAAVEVNVLELNARIGAHNLAMRAIESELDESRAWNARRLRPLVERSTTLVRQWTDLVIYSRLVSPDDRPALVTVESVRPLISQLGRCIFEARTSAGGSGFPGSEQERQAEFDDLDALSRTLAELADRESSR